MSPLARVPRRPQRRAGPASTASRSTTGTASRVRTKFESSVAISTFDRADIARLAPSSTADLIAAVPGFWVESTAGTTQGNVFARGIVQDGGYRYVGLVEDGITAVAVVYNPITEELYRATRGGGASLGDTAIQVAAPPPSGTLPIMVGSRWEIEKGILAGYSDRWELRPLGSTAYRMLKVADGSAHAFASPSRKHEWDVCAAALVVTEAGGQVASGDGTALQYNRAEPLIDGIMAWAPGIDIEPPRAACSGGMTTRG